MKIKGEIRIKSYSPEGVNVDVVSDQMSGRGQFLISGIDPEKDYESPIPFEIELKEKAAPAPAKKNGKK